MRHLAGHDEWGHSMRFVALEKKHRMHDGYRIAKVVAGRNLLLFQEDGQIHIIENRCPHADAPLDKATVREGCIRCPWHGICFDLTTGEAVSHQDMRLVKYPVMQEGTEIGILLD